MQPKMAIVSLFSNRVRISKTVLVIVMCLTLFITWFCYRIYVNTILSKDYYIETTDLHKKIVNQFYQNRKSWKTSNLGAVLYKNINYPTLDDYKKYNQYTILVWKHWEYLQKRHVYHYGNTRHDPLEGCSVQNCVFTGDDSHINAVDAVVVHLHRGLWPNVTNRNPKQRWIFLNDEGPYNAFSLAKRKINYEELHNVFNWSMTYTIDADVPVPYGRTLTLPAPKLSSEHVSLAKLVPNWKDKQRDVSVGILISNCGVNYRMKLINSLKQFINVDVHGKCGEDKLKNSCPGHFRADCEVLSKYLFYLAFENSMCKEYMTEKIFYNAYYRGAIPIIQGPSLRECETFLPPHSYLHVDNYAIIEDLANDIKRISEDNEELLNYHWWRNHFEVVNEHGYFKSKSVHLCRLCEAMNYNDDTESVYSKDDLARFFDPKSLCREYTRG